VRKADNLPPSCAVVTKSGHLNFLEPFGPVQACNGTDLLYPPLSNLTSCVNWISYYLSSILFPLPNVTSQVTPMTVIEITQWQELPHSALYKSGAAVPEFLSLVLYGGDLTASPISQLEKAPDIHRTEGLVGRGAGLEAWGNRQVLLPMPRLQLQSLRCPGRSWPPLCLSEHTCCIPITVNIDRKWIFGSSSKCSYPPTLSVP